MLYGKRLAGATRRTRPLRRHSWLTNLKAAVDAFETPAIKMNFDGKAIDIGGLTEANRDKVIDQPRAPLREGFLPRAPSRTLRIGTPSRGPHKQLSGPNLRPGQKWTQVFTFAAALVGGSCWPARPHARSRFAVGEACLAQSPRAPNLLCGRQLPQPLGPSCRPLPVRLSL